MVDDQLALGLTDLERLIDAGVVLAASQANYSNIIDLFTKR